MLFCVVAVVLLLFSNCKIVSSKWSGCFPSIWLVQTLFALVDLCFYIGYTEYTEVNKEYKFYSTPMLCGEAMKRCHEDNATLAIPKNDLEARVLRDIFEAHPPTIIPNVTREFPWPTHMLLGYHKYHSEGAWLTVTGKPMRDHYTQFFIGQPDSYSPPELCVSMERNGYLFDFPVNLQALFLCERGIKDNDITEDQGYECFPETSGCYKVHRNIEVWHRAEQVCREEDATLAILNNSVEEKTVTTMLRKALALGVSNKYGSACTYGLVGFHDIFKEGYFITVHGEPLSMVGYIKWSTKLKRENAELLDCGALDQEGLIFVSCDTPAMFICEKKYKFYNPMSGSLIV